MIRSKLTIDSGYNYSGHMSEPRACLLQKTPRAPLQTYDLDTMEGTRLSKYLKHLEALHKSATAELHDAREKVPQTYDVFILQLQNLHLHRDILVSGVPLNRQALELVIVKLKKSLEILDYQTKEASELVSPSTDIRGWHELR